MLEDGALRLAVDGPSEVVALDAAALRADREVLFEHRRLGLGDWCVVCVCSLFFKRVWCFGGLVDCF